ncbi:MAG: glycogen debranching protein [Chloroflexota bacterium]|nr:MAG: glycogen debranching protein [Chloroflexota bacterium]
MIDLDRSICCDFQAASTREWVITNGIGGYGMGTVAGVLTRRYHGLLIAALNPPLARTLLLTKLDETAIYDAHTYRLYCNEWQPDDIENYGVLYLERFRLEGSIPVWTYTLADAQLEKRVWMQHGTNTTYIRYTMTRASMNLRLSAKALVNYRDHHANTVGADTQLNVTRIADGIRIDGPSVGQPFYIRADGGNFIPDENWYLNFYHAIEAYRGQVEYDDNMYAGVFDVVLQPAESFTIVASTNPDASLDGAKALTDRLTRDRELLTSSGWQDAPMEIRQLILAADQFIVNRPAPHDPDGKTVIAGYPWFEDWGRDTMISLAGLTLTTRRPAIARSILRTFGGLVSQGMLPNRFTELGVEPEYNTVDATLWYFEAIRAYYEATQDRSFLVEIFPVLQSIIEWHQKGTRYHIHLDPHDGLIYAGETGVQLTWMDAKVDEWVVTPRIGKSIEINALWYNALLFMARIASLLGESSDHYHLMAEKAAQGLKKFWNPRTGYCFDVLDGPSGHEHHLRPNQLIALALPDCPFPPEQQKSIVDTCARQLYTPHGLRSLSPNAPDYVGVYGGDLRSRDAAYHQGTAWGWLMGPFILAHLRVYQDPALAKSYLWPFLCEINQQGLGTLSEIADGNAPFTPRGCMAQAWSVAQALLAWEAIAKMEGEKE